MSKYTMQSIAQERMKKLQAKHGKQSKPYDKEEEAEYGADTKEKTPASEEGPGKPMPPHHGGKPEGIAVMIGIGKPMHGKPMPPHHGGKPMAKHPGLGTSIEDEEPFEE